MPHYIVKLKDKYLEWSTVVDAPVTYGMELDDFKAYYKDQYGENGMKDLPARLERAEKFGTSSMQNESAEYLLSGNRAGPDEMELTLDEIYNTYCCGPIV